MRGGTLYKNTTQQEVHKTTIHIYIHPIWASSVEDWIIDLEVKDIDINFWCHDISWHQALLFQNQLNSLHNKAEELVTTVSWLEL